MATIQETLWTRIVSYVGGSGPAPTLSMYSAAGVSGVTTQTLAWVNSSIVGMTLSGTAATDKAMVTAVSASANKLLSLANGSAADNPANSLSSADFANLRITVSSSNLSLINSALGAKTNTQVQSRADVQAIVDAMQDVEATIAGNPTGGLTASDFQAVGVSGVSASNLGVISDALEANGGGKTSVAQLQSIVTDANTSIAKIMGYAASMSATAADETAGNTSFAAPTVADYANIGLVGLSAGQVTLLNSALATQGIVNTEADTKGELLAILESAQKIAAELDDTGNTNVDPTVADYQQIGLEDISSADHASVMNSYLANQAIGGAHTDTTASPDITSVVDVRTLLDEAAAVKKVLDYAAGIDNGLTFADLQQLGISTFEKDLALSLVNIRSQYTADSGYDNMNTVAEIQALLLGEPAHIVKVVSDAPTVNSASTVNVTDAGQLVTFTVTFSKELADAANALSGDNFRLVGADGMTAYSVLDNLSAVTLDMSDPSNRTYTVQFWVGEAIDENEVQLQYVADPGGTGAVKDVDNLNTADHLALADATISPTDTFKQNIDTDLPLAGSVALSGAALTDGVISQSEAGITATFNVSHAADATKLEIYAADGTTLLATADAAGGWSVSIDISTLSPTLDGNTGAGSYEFVLKQYDDDGNVDQGTYTVAYDTVAQDAQVTSNVPSTIGNADYSGPSGSEVFTISGSAQEAGTVTVVWDKDDDGVAELTQTVAVSAAGSSVWSVDFSKSDLLANAGEGTFKVSFTDAHGNTTAVPQSIDATVDAGASYLISAGLGPVIAGNDLSVALYKADGSKLGDAQYNAANQTWSYLDATRYSGVVIVVLSDPNNSTADYRDESTNTYKDLDSAKTAVIFVDGLTRDTIVTTVTPLTDLVARALGVSLSGGAPGDHSALTQAELVHADTGVATLFGINTAVNPLWQQTPSFTVDAVGTDTSATANTYGLALAAISEAERAGSLNSETLLADLASKLTIAPDGSVSLAAGPNVTTLIAAVSTVLDAAHTSAGAESALRDAFLVAADNTSPALVIISDKSALKAGETATITFTFSEEVTGFDDADVVVTGGTLGPLTGSGLTRTATFTPEANQASGVASITVAAGAYTDAALNAGGAGTSPSIGIDTLVPVAPVLALGAGVADGASVAEVTAATGAVSVSGENGAAITVTFTNGTKTVTKTLTGTGSAQAVVLAAADLATLGDGTITVAASQIDASGNAQGGANATSSFTLDTAIPVAPTLVLGTGVANGATAAEATSAAGVVTVSGESGAAITVTFTNGTRTVTKTVTGTGSAQAVVLAAADVTALGDGAVTVTAKQVDASGNAQSAADATTSFTLDTMVPAAPTLALGTGVANGATAAEATAAAGAVTVNGENGAAITVTFTNGTKTVTKTVTGTGSTQAVILDAADVATLGDGTVTVTARQVDASGNAQSAANATTSFMLDTGIPVAPTLTLGTGVANGATAAEATDAAGVVAVNGENGAAITVTFTNGTKTVTKTVTGTGAAQPVILTAADLIALGDGTVSVSASQVDASGNAQSVASGTTSFTLDTVVPASPTLALGAGVANGATSAEATVAGGVVTVSGENGAAITVTFTNGTKTVTKTVTGTGSAQAVVLAAADLTTLGDGTISVAASQVDASGNVQSAANASTSFTLDTMVPAAPALALGTGVADGATGAEATAAGGVVTVSGENGAAITVTFTNGTKTVTKTVTGTGSAQAVVLAAADLTALGDGTIGVSASQVDASGNAQSAANATTSFTLDTVIPGAPILTLGTGVANGATAAEATAVAGVVTVSGESGAAITVTFTNGTKAVTKTLTGTGSAQAVVLDSADLTALGDGTVSVSASQVGAAGAPQNGANATTTFTLDTVVPVAPTLALGTGVANGATSAEATAAGGVVTVSGESGAAITVTFTNGTKTVTKTVTGTGSAQAVVLAAADLTTLGDGTISVSARQVDASGNAQSAANASTSFSLDTGVPVAPTLALGTGVANGATAAEATAAGGVVTVSGENGAAITVTFTNGTKTVTKTVTGSGSAQAVVLAAADLTALGDGTIAVSARQVDASGNAQSAANATTSFTLDTVVPMAPTLALGTGVANGATSAEATAAGGVVTVSGESGAAITVTFTNGTKTVTKTVTGTGSAQAVVLAAADLTTLGDGTIAVSARQVDASGNAQSAANATTSFTLDTAVPAAPTLVLGTGVANGATSAEATAAGGVVTVSGESGAAITVTFTNGTKTVTKTVTGTGSAQAVVLAAADLTSLGDGTISVSALQVDASGNAQSAASATTTFTLDTAVPVAPTLALGTGVADGATSAEATAAGGVLTVTGESGAAITVTFTNGTKTVTKTVTGTGSAQAVVLAAADLTTLGDGTISVSARQVDASGNAQSAANATTSFTLDTVVPAAPTLALGTGVSNGASASEAVAAGGVVTVSGESGAAITVTFTNGTKTVTKTVTGTGSAQAVVLAAADLTTLGDGTIGVSARQVDASGNAQSAANATTSFTLDTVVPVAPTLALGTGVANGATSAEATAAGGVVTVSGESGAAIAVTFTNGTKTVTKTVTGTGSAQAVVLAAADLTSLGDGTISVSARQVDASGNAQSAANATTSFTLDTVVPAAPTLALGTGVANGATSTEATAATGAVTVSGESGAAITVTFTNGTKTVTKTVTGTGSAQAVVLAAADLTTLGDGTIAVSARQVDASGNAQSAANATTSFTLDTVVPAAPTLVLGTGVANGATSAEATAAGGVVTVSGESGAAITVTFTNGTKTVTKTVTGTGSAQAVVLAAADLTSLGDGTISVSARQVDASGNAQSAANATSSFTLDTVVPVAPTLVLGTGVANGATSAEATAAGGVVTVSGESGAAITVTFTNGTKTVTKSVTGTGSAQAVVLAAADLTALGDGTISVSARQVDASGNAQSAANATTTFTLDTAVPIAPTLALGTGVADGATSAEATAAGGVVTVSGESGAAITVTFTNGTKTVTKTVTGTGSAQAVVLAAADLTTLGNGTVSVSASQVDASGNAQSAANATTSFTLDTVVPAAPTLALGTGVANGASASEAVAAGGVVTVSGESGAAITVTFTNGTKTVTKTVTGTGSAQAVVLAAADLTALGDGTVSVSARQVDAAGNAQSAANATTSFTLDATVPAAPTLALGTGVTNGATSAEATAATGVVTVSGETGAAITVTFTNGTKTVTKTVTGTGSAQAIVLAAADLTTLGDGTISVSARQVDTAGNAQSAANATTSFTLDRAAPVFDLNQADGTSIKNWNVVATATSTQYAIHNATSTSTKALLTEASNVGVIAIAVNTAVSAGTLAGESLTIGGTVVYLDGHSLPSTVAYGGQSWSVSYSSGVITLTAASGASSGLAQGLIRSMTYAASTLPTGGSRSLSFTITDYAGNVGNIAVATVVADGAGPVVDWDGSGSSPFSITRAVTAATTAVDLEATANIATLTDGSAIGSVTLTVSGLVNSGAAERMVVGATNVAFATNASSTVTVSSVVWTWSYTANGASEGTFVFSKNGGGTVTAAQAQALMRALSYQQTSAADGVRTFTLSAADQYDNATTAPAVVTMTINGSAPTLATASTAVAGTTMVNGTAYTSYSNGQLATLDINGDGRLGDGFIVTFSEGVNVSKATTVANWTLSSSRTLGVGATITALDPVTVGGTQYATRFLFKAGTGANYTTGTTLTIAAANVTDTGGVDAAAPLVVTMTDIVAPSAPVAPIAVAGDNRVNATELAATTLVAFTHAAAVAGDTLVIYRDGVAVKSIAMTTGATSTSVSMTGAGDWGADGTNIFTAKVQDVAGNSSLASAPKPISVDTTITSGFAKLFASLDAGTVGAANPGDVLRIEFNESVQITNASLPASFGTGASVAAVGGVNGVSKIWAVTLGTAPTVSGGNNVTFTGVTDEAGNTGVITGTVPIDVFNTPGTPTIGTVAGDDVINASEIGSAQSVTVNLSQTKAGDVVKLYMDGVQVGVATVASNGQSAVSISVAANSWGADGERQLSATVQRGSGTIVSNTVAKPVYVAADATHWSEQSGYDVIWFDPNSLANQTLGSSIASWAAKKGGFSLTTFNGVTAGIGDTPATLTMDPTGNLVVYLNNTVLINSTDFQNSTRSTSAGFSDFASFKFTVEPPGSSGTFVGVPMSHGVYKGLGTNSDTTSIFAMGIVKNSATSLNFSIQEPGYGGITTIANALAVGAWGMASASVANQFGSATLDGSATQTTYNFATRPTGSSAAWDSGRTAFVVGGRIYSGDALSLITGQIGDVISIGGVMSQAYAQEVGVYQVAKLHSAGSWAAAKAVGSTYDLSVSASNTEGVLLDDGLELNKSTLGTGADTITTAGTDYVNAGAGNDTLKVKDLNFRVIDGGQGIDTLQLHSAYTGSESIVLADFVSNSRGLSGNTTADDRVNAAGYHKLYGIEAIDLSTSTAVQNLTVAAADVNQLSEDNKLWVTLGTTGGTTTESTTDTLTATGFTAATPTWGYYTHTETDGSTAVYDRKWTGTDGGKAVELYASGGKFDTVTSATVGGTGTNKLATATNETLTGTASKADTFAWFSGTSGSDTVASFSKTEGDKIDLRGLLSGSGIDSSNFGNYLQLTQSGNNAVLKIDTEGSAGFLSPVQQITFTNGYSVGGLNDTLQKLVEQHVVVFA